MDEINWEDRLIGIKGSRGVGKTTFLLDYAREVQRKYPSRTCLYINLNQFFFTTTPLVDFVKAFYEKGGRLLLLDQVFKYPNWSQELRESIDTCPGLKIVFTGSSVMELDENNPDLKGIISVYELSGFSFREFLNLKGHLNLKPYSLEDILTYHDDITKDILSVGNPRDWFQDYLHHGYSPVFLEQRNFSENLLKTINMTLEVDVLFIRQIEQRFLHKLRKLLYLVSIGAPAKFNVSKLAAEIETSRATVMNYLTYLRDAKLIRLIYKNDDKLDSTKKPALIDLDNTNLTFLLRNELPDRSAIIKTFLFNQLSYRHTISVSGKGNSFIHADNKFEFKVVQEQPLRGHSENRYFLIPHIEKGSKDIVPLWLLGFLY